MIKENDILSQDIKIAMLINGINKRILSQKLCLSYPTVLKYLNNPYELNIGDFEKICNILKVNPKELLIKK